MLFCNLKNGRKPVKTWLYASPGFFISREAESIGSKKLAYSQNNFHPSVALGLPGYVPCEYDIQNI